jgi:peptide/nickel transport system permease protein
MAVIRPGPELIGPAAPLDRPRLESQKRLYYYTPQWKLVWWRFRQHKLVPMAGVLLVGMYALAAFCEFLSPYGPQTSFQSLANAPPATIRFTQTDSAGRTRLVTPYVLGYTVIMNPETFRRTMVPDETKTYPLRFFSRGEPYKLWGAFPANLHLFSTAKGDGPIYLFGSDDLARDIFTRTLYGSRVSLTIGLVGITISMVLGLTIGGLAGYYGGLVDEVCMRLIDFLISIPTLPLWMSLSAALPRDWPVVKTYFAITLIFSIISWSDLARTVRGKILALREEDFTKAAIVCGSSEWFIITRHLLPLFFSYIVIAAMLAIPGMILGETSLSFIGLGMQPPAVSWGVLLRDAQAISEIAFRPWKLIPGAFVVVTVLMFNFLGNGLRDAADPYQSVKR